MRKKAWIAVGALALCLSPVAANAVQSEEARPSADAVQTDDVRPKAGMVQIQNAATGKCLKGASSGLVVQDTCDKNDDRQFWFNFTENRIALDDNDSTLRCMTNGPITTIKGCAGPGQAWIGGVPDPSQGYRAMGGNSCYLKVVPKGAIKCTPGFDSKSAKWRAR